MTKPYRFISKWKIKASQLRVRQAIRYPEHWSQWWPGVSAERVEGAAEPTFDTTWRSHGYTLQFRITVHHDGETEMAYTSEGDLVGEGKMSFQTDPAQPEYTTVVIGWDVVPTKRWMRLLSPILMNRFRANHDEFMSNGEAGLQRYLQINQ